MMVRYIVSVQTIAGTERYSPGEFYVSHVMWERSSLFVCVCVCVCVTKWRGGGVLMW